MQAVSLCKIHLFSLVTSFSALALAACGNGTSDNCLKAPVSPAKGTPQQPLKLTKSEEQSLGLGSAYLDITTTDAAGRAQSRRCTAALGPDGDDPSRVILWTANHCLYDISSEEYKNSKYVIQVYDRGGYFSAPAQLDSFDLFGRIARTIAPLATQLPAHQSNRAKLAFSESSVNPCKTATEEFAKSLGRQRKKIACFSKNELRGLNAQLELKAENVGSMKAVLDVLRAREAEILAQMTERDRLIFELRRKSLLLKDKAPFHFRTFAYWLNPTHCATPTSDLPRDENGLTEPKSLCSSAVRNEILRRVKEQFPDQFPEFSSIAEKQLGSVSELKALHSDVIACRFNSLDEIDPKTVEFKSVCDIEKFNRLIWRKWVQPGVEALQLNQLAQLGKRGFDSLTYFSLLTNADEKKSKKSARKGGRSRFIPISETTGRLSPAELNSQVVLVNFNPENAGFNLEKGDSGSLFSIFSSLPVGTLSTLDGEPTSGGTAILPLPQIGESEEESPKSELSCR